MPDATITSTASTFGTISGTFAADQSTITGTITGVVAGTLDGSVGVPGPQGPTGATGAQGPQGIQGVPGEPGPGLPAGGLEGQIIVKNSDGIDYDTIWTDNSAETLTVRATNKTGSTLNKGAVVRINGAQGQRPTIDLAQGNSGSSADGVIGILLATLANNATGLVCTAGLAKRLDTSAYTEGVKLFLSPSVAGGLTPTRPSAPDHAVAVGIVSHSSATTGSIEVNVVVGDHLEWLHDVLITTPTNGQVLKYDSATSLWVNGTDLNSGVWGSITGTLSSQTDLQTALNLKAPLESPVFTGDARAATPSLSDNDTSIATTAFVKGQSYLTSSALTPYAPLAGATFTGSVTFDGVSNSVVFRVPSYDNPAVIGQGDVWIDTTYKLYYGVVEYFEGEPNRIAYQIARIADLAPYAPLASPVFTGDPRSVTPSTSDNDTSIATTAFVKAQGYLTSAPVTSVAGRTGAVTLAVADVSDAAPLASPTFTGTPSLPTGTIGVTQTAGNNTTALATTAFVQQEVPDFATDLQAVVATSTTTVISPRGFKLSCLSTNVWAPSVSATTGAVSGTGANTGSTISALDARTVGPNASTAGYATRGFTLRAPSNSTNGGYNFSTESGHSIRIINTFWGSTVTGIKLRAVFGRIGNSLPVPATLAARGYGWEWDLSTRTMNIIAHNGTTLTTSAVTWNPTSNRTYEIAVTSNGSGTITLYIDGTQIGSTTGGPTGTVTGAVWWQTEIQNEATAASQQEYNFQNPKVFTTNG